MREKARNLSPANQRRLLLYLYWLRLRELILPRLVFSRGAGSNPVFFSMLASVISLSMLGFLPHRVLSMAISFGGGLSFSLIFTSIRRARFPHMIG